MQRIAMLGSGFIARFYADSLQGYRNRDKVVSVYSRKEESAKKYAEDYKVNHWIIKIDKRFYYPGMANFKTCIDTIS
jgi:predicted dehydrogenase